MANTDYSRLSIDKLIDEYRAGATALSDAIRGVADDELRVRVAPGKWSIHEVLCHVADFELVNAERIRRVLSEHEPTLFNGDPSDFERGLLYDIRDPQEELNVIGTLRSQTARILRNVPSDAWQRRGVHSTDGPLTLRQLVERVTKHIPHHIAFITGKRATIAGRR